MKIKKLPIGILITLFVLEMAGSVPANYLLRINFFQPVSDFTNHLITPTLLVNLMDIIIYSVIVFVFGKLSFSSVWMSKEKVRESLIPVLLIWGITQLIILVYTFFTTKDFLLTQDVSARLGRIIGQLFGNALNEEFLFRGIFFLQLYLILKNYKTNKPAIIIAIIISQLIFSLMHIPNRMMIKSFQGIGIDLLLIFITGVILTLIYLKTENIAFVIGGHALINSRINIIETTFPWQITSLIIFVLIAVFWGKLTKGERYNLWRNGQKLNARQYT